MSEEFPETEVDTSGAINEEGGPGQADGQKFAIGLTPFGHIGINVTDSNGQTAGYLITDPDDAARIIVHLQAVTTMMIQSMYAAAMQEKALAQELIAQNGGGGGLWTPPKN